MVVRERASRALSMPVAFRVAGLLVESAKGVESSWERSRVPLDFLGAVLALAPLGVERWDFSSAAKRASRSPFFGRPGLSSRLRLLWWEGGAVLVVWPL